MSTRSVAIASCVTVAAGFGLMAIHYFGGDPNDPEGWFSAAGFGAPFVGAGGISLTGIRSDKRELCLAGAFALAVMSIVSIVMFPLIAAAAVMAVGSHRSLNSESLAIPAILGVALVGVFALVVFHQDPIAWSSPNGSGSASNVVTPAEAATSLAVVIVVMASSVVWSNRRPRPRRHRVADDNVPQERRMIVMDRRRAARTVAIAWAGVGGAIAIAGLRDVNADARALVGVATLLGIVSAVAASGALTHRRERVAGVLLVVSALATPTFFAYALNLVPLLIGIVLFATARSSGRTDKRSRRLS